MVSLVRTTGFCVTPARFHHFASTGTQRKEATAAVVGSLNNAIGDLPPVEIRYRLPEEGGWIERIGCSLRKWMCVCNSMYGGGET